MSNLDRDATALGGRLAEIDAILKSVRGRSHWDEQEALRRIKQVLRRSDPDEAASQSPDVTL